MGYTTDMAGRRVAVLGGTGFVGRHVCAALTAAGAEVTTVSRTEPADPDGEPPGRWAGMDLAGAPSERIAALLADLDAAVVVNCAGAVWRPTPEQLRSGNVDLVVRLMAALGRLDRPPRLVQLGSVHEYGAGAEHGPTPEDHPTAPVTDYGLSKLRGSQAVIDAARAGGLDAVVLRAANSTGPHLPRGSLLGGIAGRLADFARSRPAAGVAMPLSLAPLTVRRDFVDIRDVADAVVSAAAPAGPPLVGEVVNVGSGRAVPVRELVDLLIGLSGVPVRVSPVAEGAARRDVERLELSITKAAHLWDWRPRRDLKRSLADMLAAA
ncbi:NAD(P)-dependent oxidoreductase [Micromonospora sp. NPDC002296]|uniref:NAD-dependent epimerase/dehydratase family protein n=1 Tax=Micromonospora sp. NPDC002296 TaxID=3154271 RepID=UPI00331764B8